MRQGWFVARNGWRLVVRRAQMPPTPEEQEVLDREFWDAVKNVKDPYQLSIMEVVSPGSEVERRLFDLDKQTVSPEDMMFAESISACFCNFGHIPAWALAPKKKRKK